MPKINEGFFVVNSTPFKDKEGNRYPRLLEEHVDKASEVKYIVSDKHIMIDADSKEARDKITKLNKLLNIKPYSYETSKDHMHFWYALDDSTRQIVDFHGYHSSSKQIALDEKIDTRAFNVQTQKTGAVYLKTDGKKKSGRPLPEKLLSELDKDLPVVPYLLLLHKDMGMIRKSGDDWHNTTLPIVGKMKAAKWTKEMILNVFHEAAIYHGDQHNESEILHKIDEANEIFISSEENKLEKYIQRPIDKKTKQKKVKAAAKGILDWDRASDVLLENFDMVMYRGKLPMVREDDKWKRLDAMPVEDIKKYIINKRMNIPHDTATKLAKHAVMLIRDVEPKLNRNYIYLKNGYFDYTTGKFTEEKNPEYNHRRLDVNYVEPKKGSEAVTKLETFLKSYMTKENPEIFKQICEMWAGILVPTEISRKIFHLFGNGYNGKSELMKFTNAFIGGERTSTLDLNLLTSSKATDRLQMVDKMLNYIDELENTGSNKGIGQLKALSAGGPTTAEIKYGASFTFNNEATIVIGANDILKMTERSNALEDRLHPIFFTKRFKDENGNRINTGFDPSTIRHDEEVHEAAVYAACHHAFLLNKKQWKFHMTTKSEELANERKLETDKVYAFYCWYIEQDCAAWRIKKADLYKIFVEWCKQNGRKDMSRSSFGKNILKQKGVSAARTSTDGYYEFEGLKDVR